MRNVIVAPFPPPLGGVSAAATNLRDVFSDAGVDVEVFNTSSHSKREDLYSSKGASSYWRNLGLFFTFLGKVFSQQQGDTAFHVFVTSDKAFFRDALFLVLLRLARRDVAIHLHSKTAGEYFVAPSRLRFFGQVLSLAQRIFVLSAEHLQFFSDFIPIEKLTVLENFVQSKEFEVGPNSSSLNMLYVSRLSKMKGTWELLEAVRTLSTKSQTAELRVTIAGAADTDENEVRFREFITEHGLQNVVTMAGLVTGADKTALFRDHGVFVFPSRFENSPVTLKEANQAGMAIIASDIPANLNILIRSGNHLTFPVGDSKALADKMLSIMKDSDLYVELRNKARACQKFDEVYAKDVLTSYLS